ncbi:lysoplasmalogenase [Marinobacter lacisalsi]|uniref:Lysoplasmalogenase n=1 Tax=Marinobacter lacisalsi TaxID=475979 RepID=A0ABV8QEF4_9GAMM
MKPPLGPPPPVVPSTIWLLVFAGGALLYIVFRDVFPQGVGWLFKIIPIALLLQFVVTKASGNTRNLLVAALVLSGIGDILLSLDGLFIPGLGAFLLAQLTYTALFLTQFHWRAGRLFWAAGVVGYTLACTLYIIPQTGDLQVVTTVYMAAISLMAISAGFRADRQFLWVAVGALIFMISDTLIAIDKFVSSFAWSGVAVMTTYYAAQLLICFGMVRHGSDASPEWGKHPAR